ncbi:MAG: glycosyltransferase [Micropepsaceae bacterium]
MTGGAEAMLLKLISRGSLDFKHSVISLQTKGTIGPKLEAVGVEVFALNMAGGRIPGVSALKLMDLLDSLRPDLIQAWMYHANLGTTLARSFLRQPPPLYWSIRCSLSLGDREKWLTAAVVRGCAYISSSAQTIIYNSRRSMQEHSALGYKSKGARVIANGFDLKQFSRSAQFRSQLRETLHIPPNAFVVGMLARLHPMKDHRTFLATARNVVSQTSDTYFVAAGRGVPELASQFPDLVAELGTRLVLLPEFDAVEKFMSALDIFLLTSAWGEGFPNVLGEAMACELPCITTDAGDSAHIVDKAGIIVAPADVVALARETMALYQSGPDRLRLLGEQARERVRAHFSIERAVSAYEACWRAGANAPRTPHHRETR